MRIGEATNWTELVQAAESARQRRLEARRGYETIWWNNIALVAGDHYASWNPTLARYEDRDPTWTDELAGKKPRMVINHALTVARTELSKLTKAHPIMDVIANSDEQGDIAATMVGRSALDFAEWKFKLRKMRKEALWWMIETGLGALYVGYDSLDDNAGKMQFLIDPATGEPTFSPARKKALLELSDKGEVDLEYEEHPLGDLELKVYSPFQLFPDELATDFENIKDLIVTDIEDVDVIQDLYPGGKINPDPDIQIGVMERRALTRAGIQGGVTQAAQNIENGLRVHTLWLPPGVYRRNKFLANGVMLRWCQTQKVLEKAPSFPFQDGRIPFVFFQHIPRSETIWPDSVMSHIRGPNLEIDKTVSQLIENKDYMANPMWRIATQHRIRGEIKNVAGGIVRYRHVPNVPPPEPVQGLQMPNQVENLLVGLREQILDISGQSEVARGRVPTGVRSGVAVAYLQEEDDTKIAPTIENMEEAIAMMGSMVLERFSQFYTLSRIIRFFRRDGVFEARKFKGADLKNNTDVICQAGSAMPRSKAARQQYALELISLGVLTDKRKIEQILELGQGEPDDMDKSIAQANRENNVMRYGVPTAMYQLGQEHVSDEELSRVAAAVPVKEWHNHQVHIMRHTSMMMDEDFDKLQISHPEVVRLFDEHISMHQQMLQKQQAAQAQMLLAAKGAPDGPPGNSGSNGAAPGAQDSGFQPNSFMTTADVPDVIGGGVVQTRARQIRGQG